MNIRTALFALALAAALPLAAQAASGTAPQGFDAPAAAQTSQDKAPQGFGPTTPTTVENVIKNGADDEYVILRGRFTSHIKSDKYEFQDEAGGVNSITTATGQWFIAASSWRSAPRLTVIGTAPSSM